MLEDGVQTCSEPKELQCRHFALNGVAAGPHLLQAREAITSLLASLAYWWLIL